MESHRIAVLVLALALLFPSLFPIFVILSALFILVPKFIEEHRKRKCDDLSLKILLKLSSIPNITYERVTEVLSNYDCFLSVKKKFDLGKFDLPEYGWKTRIMKRAIDLSLSLGNTDILSKAANHLLEVEEMESETKGLLEQEKLTLLASISITSAIIGLMFGRSQMALMFVLFQSIISSIWLYFISEFSFFESLSIVFSLSFLFLVVSSIA